MERLLIFRSLSIIISIDGEGTNQVQKIDDKRKEITIRSNRFLTTLA